MPRRRPDPARLADPLGQPEVPVARLRASVYVLTWERCPPEAAALLREVRDAALECAVLAACAVRTDSVVLAGLVNAVSKEDRVGAMRALPPEPRFETRLLTPRERKARETREVVLTNVLRREVLTAPFETDAPLWVEALVRLRDRLDALVGHRGRVARLAARSRRLNRNAFAPYDPDDPDPVMTAVRAREARWVQQARDSLERRVPARIRRTDRRGRRTTPLRAYALELVRFLRNVPESPEDAAILEARKNAGRMDAGLVPWTPTELRALFEALGFGDFLDEAEGGFLNIESLVREARRARTPPLDFNPLVG